MSNLARIKDTQSRLAPNSHPSTKGVFTVSDFIRIPKPRGRNVSMKTKTTITVETYRFSTVRLRRERATPICVGCGREITPSEGNRPIEITSEIHTQRIKNNNGEIK